MSLTAFLRKVVAVLEEAGVAHMLTGSLAAAYYAVPRATQDVDVVIETQEEGIDRLVEGLLAVGWYVDRDAALEMDRKSNRGGAVYEGKVVRRVRRAQAGGGMVRIGLRRV